MQHYKIIDILHSNGLFGYEDWLQKTTDGKVFSRTVIDDQNDESSSLLNVNDLTLEATSSEWQEGRYRTIDGVDNNIENPEWGTSDENFIRFEPYGYDDGISTLSGQDRPSPREISNVIFNQTENTINSFGASNIFWLWGQFLDHDLDLTKGSLLAENMEIQIPMGDPFFDPFSTGDKVMIMTRSGFDPDTGTTIPREQVNLITSFIDASNVYGSDPLRQEFLRDEGGKLKISEGDFMPFNDGTQENAGGPSTTLFVAGDVRSNENVALTMMHTIFVREHNRLVDEIAAQHPEYDADTLYQEAKVIVEAYIQAITFNEFLPLLLGEDAIPEYTGYDPDIDPGIANVFATAAFRLGHTLLSGTLFRIDEYGNVIEGGNLSLRDAFFRPDQMLVSDGPDSLIRGMVESFSQELDEKLVDDVRNFLFGPPGSGGLDLGSLNIERGRDHGLADYNTVREWYGLDRVTSFADITSDVELQQKLEQLFGDVNNIDVFVGGLVEDPVAGSQLGELFHAIVLDQFLRVRDGDRFWYEDRLSPELVDEINNTTLSDIILRNSDIDYLQKYILLAYDRMGGTDDNDTIHGSDGRDLMIGFDGQDKLFGSLGNDEIFGGKGDDILNGGYNDDRLHGEEGNDKLSGGMGNDWLSGDAGNDGLKGDNGNDILIGGEGNDKLTGGNGADNFLFNLHFDGLGNLVMEGNDTINDYKVSSGDVLVFDGVNDFAQLTDHASLSYIGPAGKDLLISFDIGSITINNLPGVTDLSDPSLVIQVI